MPQYDFTEKILALCGMNCAVSKSTLGKSHAKDVTARAKQNQNNVESAVSKTASEKRAYATDWNVMLFPAITSRCWTKATIFDVG